MSAPAVLAAAVMTLGVVMIGAALRPLVLAPVRTTTAPAAPGPARRWRRRSRADGPTEVVMAEWCEHVARSVRGGSSLRRAMDDAGARVPQAAAVMTPVLGSLDRGSGLAGALATLDDDPATPVGLVVAVLAACAELGGPAASPLDRTAATLHARAAERAERATASAQARLSARVLTALPVGTLGLLAVAEPATRRAVTSPAGLACLAIGGVANVVGWWWMRRVIGRVA